jgi:heme-degrading monooxygenase HmoA
MSVLVTLRVAGDGSKIEQEDKAMMQSIVERAKGLGLIRHRFYGTENEVLVVDEWPDEGSFQKFFASSPEIAQVMARAGVTAEPEVRFWRKLDVGDDFG